MTKTIMFMNTRGQDVWFLMWQFCLLTWLGKICVPVVRIVRAQVNFHLLHCYCFVLFVVCSVIFSCYSFCSTCFCTLCTTHRLTFKSCCCYCSVLSFLIFNFHYLYWKWKPEAKKITLTQISGFCHLLIVFSSVCPLSIIKTFGLTFLGLEFGMLGMSTSML